MVIHISRIYGNVDFTIGIASIEGAKFRCYTLERRSADHSNSKNKRNNHAVPCGEYDFKFMATPISPLTPVSFLIKGYGHVRIVKFSSFEFLSTGDITFFKAYPSSGKGEITEQVYKVFESICYERARSAASANLSARGVHKFVIDESDDFVYDENYESSLRETIIKDVDFIEDEDNEIY